VNPATFPEGLKEEIMSFFAARDEDEETMGPSLPVAKCVAQVDQQDETVEAKETSTSESSMVDAP
jgi:CRISPR/Cas system-associated endonuclease/helicase Cas3